MKKIIALILTIVLVLGLGACGNSNNAQPTNEPEKQIDSLELLIKMFDKAEMDLLPAINVMDEEMGERCLNYKNFNGTEDEKEILLKGFLSGVLNRPMMSPSTAKVVIMQFENNDNFAEYKEALKNIRFSEVCVVPDEEFVHIVEKDNFLIYICYQGQDSDLGLNLVAALDNLDLTTSPNLENNAIFEETLQIYNNNKEKFNISEVGSNSMAYYPFTKEENSQFVKEDFGNSMYITSKIDYTSEEKTSDFVSYVFEIKNVDKIDAIKTELEKLANDRETNYYRINSNATVTITVKDNLLILEAK